MRSFQVIEEVDVKMQVNIQLTWYLVSSQVHTFFSEFFSADVIVGPTNSAVVVHPICTKISSLIMTGTTEIDDNKVRKKVLWWLDTIWHAHSAWYIWQNTFTISTVSTWLFWGAKDYVKEDTKTQPAKSKANLSWRACGLFKKSEIV